MMHFAVVSRDGRMWLDLAGRAQRVQFSTNAHGYSSFTCRVPMSLAEAFGHYDHDDTPEVIGVWQGQSIWRGRLEDVEITSDGLALQALGAWRALGDVPYTALWTQTRYAGWRPLTADDRVDSSTEKFTTDNNNRIYIALTKETEYDTTTLGRMGYNAPDRGQRPILLVKFNYEVNLPADYTARLISAAGSFGGTPTVEWSLTGDGSLQVGTETIVLTGSDTDALWFEIEPTDAVLYSGETGDDYLKITALRIQSTLSAAVYADEIAAALVDYIAGVNPDQISTSKALIETPDIDLSDETYLDELPSDILTRLAVQGNSGERWACGVYDERQVFFRPLSAVDQHWYVDITSVELERTIDTLINSAYAIYRDANNNTLRTDVGADTASVAAQQLTRRRAMTAQTTSLTQAEAQRDAFLRDGATPTPRIKLKFEKIFNGAGALYPLWSVRAGDVMTIRNLPPALSVNVDRVRTFRVTETRYDADTNTLEVTPELPKLTLDVMLSAERPLKPAPFGDEPSTAGGAPPGAGWSTTTGQITFTLDGEVSVETGKLHFHNGLKRSIRLVRAVLSVDTAPAGDALIVDVNVNGVSVFSTPDDRPRIADGETSGEAGINALLPADAELTIDIDQVGSATAGSDLVVGVVFAK